MARETATSVHRFEAHETALYATLLGEGRPLVLLHGGLADHHACLPMVPPLTAAGFRAIMPDLRGSGRSIYRGPLSWELLADDLAALLDSLQLERAIVAGVSSGSGVALRFALRHPGRLTALALISPVYEGAEAGLTPEQRALFEHMDAHGRRTLAEGTTALHPLFEALPEPIRARARAIAGGFDPASVAATTAFLVSGAQPFAALSDLQAIGARVVVVPGDDALHPGRIATAYARALSACEVCRLEELSAKLAA